MPEGGAECHDRVDHLAVRTREAVRSTPTSYRSADATPVGGPGHLGTVDSALHAAGSVLLESADAIDHGHADGESRALLALRVRQVVADAVQATIRVADHALGPGPLAFEGEHTTRVSDLRVYVRQHHAERDAAALGKAAAMDQPW